MTAARGAWAACLLALVLAAAATAPDSERRGARLVKLDEVPLRTSGRFIVNNRGERVKWACVNWYGAYSTRHAVGGLEVLPIQVIVKRIVDLGFNCVRMMYSTEAYVHNPLVSNDTVSANPHMLGMRWQEIFDLTIQAMTDARLMVIINNHNSKSGWCCHYSQDEGLWYVPEYSEAQWIDSLVSLTSRYRNNSMVVAIDLRNEVHDYKDTHLTWGDGNPKTDWAAAATRSGNAVLAANPDVLIVVMAMCFGMDLRPAREKPIQLSHSNRVVYQAHNYLEYQIFDNVSKMLKPWHEIRNWTLFFILVLMVPTLLLLRGWWALGRTRPPPGVGYITIGFWLMIFMLAGTVISWSIYSFGQKFCSIAMHTDVVPWLVGCSISLGLSVLLILLGVAKLWLSGACRRQPPAAEGQEAEEANPPPQLTAAKVDEEAAPQEGQAAPVPGAADGKRTDSGGDGAKALICCSTGAASIKQAGKCMVEDARRVAFRVWGLEVGPRAPEVSPLKEPAEWDIAMCCGLQLLTLLVILMTTFMFLYIWAHILPTYWWMERHLDGLWGFALEEGFPFTAPVWMGEFGQNTRGQYWLNFARYLSTRDVDFAYWALNGRKWSEGYVDSSSGEFVNYEEARWESESFGILDVDYMTVRHTWKLLDLQALMDSPARWTADVLPCRQEVMGPSCGAR
mmetsp:Transcript_80351/g.260309  ORF Transcript_80351/g.260309 Transcript_80351/m.260309 type:complete len:678 (+) Transcript_80351:63-2096(+)